MCLMHAMHIIILMPTVDIKTHMTLIKVPHSLTNLPYNKIIRHYPKLVSASHKPQLYKYVAYRCRLIVNFLCLLAQIHE